MLAEGRRESIARAKLKRCRSNSLLGLLPHVEQAAGERADLAINRVLPGKILFLDLLLKLGVLQFSLTCLLVLGAFPRGTPPYTSNFLK